MAMWSNTTKWLQEKAQEVAAKAEEVRQSRVVSDLEAQSKTFFQTLVAASENNDFFRSTTPTNTTPAGPVLHYITDKIIGMGFPDPVEQVCNSGVVVVLVVIRILAMLVAVLVVIVMMSGMGE